jgi:hypothetical protein
MRPLGRRRLTESISTPPDALCPQRIMSASYSFPPGLNLSAEVLDLFSKIFVCDVSQRYTMAQICQHPWFLKNLPSDLVVSRGGRWAPWGQGGILGGGEVRAGRPNSVFPPEPPAPSTPMRRTRACLQSGQSPGRASTKSGP